jgi:hypothetical protein
MPDFDAIPGTRNAWREPRLYAGNAAARPLLRYDGGQAGSVTVRVGSVAAEFRRPAGNCRVAAGVRVDPDERICLMVVATGTGSEAGRRAADRATETATRFPMSAPNDLRPTGRDLLRIAGDCARFVNDDLNNDQKELRRARRPDAEFRTGLLLAVFPLEVPAGDSVAFAVVRVGHGAAWRVRPGSLDEIAFPGAGTGQAHRVGPTLPANATLLRSIVETVDGRLRDGEVLALTTEGLVRDEQDPAREFLAPVWAAPPRPLDFLRQLAVRRGDRDTDRAAAVAWIGHHELP